MRLIKGLGYVAVAASDIERWRHFAFGVLGFFAQGKGSDASALYLRMDERAARIIVVPPGDVDKIVTVGWEVRDHADLERVKTSLDSAGSRSSNCPCRKPTAGASRKRSPSKIPPEPRSRSSTVRSSTTPPRRDPPVRRPIRHRQSGTGPRRAAGLDVDGAFAFYTDVLGGFTSRGAFRSLRRPSSGRSGCVSWVSTNDTTVWRYVPRKRFAIPGSST